ncbi:MAG: Coenzyme F420 hydrogenase/dehydrogenase, beta subunit C-terminal domain [Ruminococcus sp.]|nr:Coenzyme F420 hydrogenase/dehydrogenase, beta subunit C-terminal domain [Ruminococcus sp.]
MPISEPAVFAVKHKDEGIRAASRSGGIFTALSDAVLSEQGIIYGCVMTDDFRAVHIRADDAETRNRMRGSKYIQSELGDIFYKVKTDLQHERKVLFSGTSCQISGLKSYLTKPYENLLCVDIICHGVPSPLVWQHYLDWQAEQAQSPVKSVDFRNKKDYGWKAHIETLTFENEKRIDSEVFRKLFYSHRILRPSCHQCPYKSVHHLADITIADYWGIDRAAPDMNDNKGISLVLVNSQLGREYFDRVRSELEYRETALEDSLQPPLKAPFPPAADREQFWDDFRNRPFRYIVKKYGTVSFMSKLKKKIRRILK